MSYYDSGCTFDDIRNNNGFSIERHSLKITQPMSNDDNDGRVRNLKCSKNVYGTLDYAKGYSNWFYLSHIDFKVPSEHAQNGIKYDGEIQLHHFFSVSTPESKDKADNEVCTTLRM
jgi:hypothetical protein